MGTSFNGKPKATVFPITLTRLSSPKPCGLPLNMNSHPLFHKHNDGCDVVFRSGILGGFYDNFRPSKRRKISSPPRYNLHITREVMTEEHRNNVGPIVRQAGKKPRILPPVKKLEMFQTYLRDWFHRMPPGANIVFLILMDYTISWSRPSVEITYPAESWCIT